MKVDIYVEDTYGDKVNVYDCHDHVRLSTDTNLLIMTTDQTRELRDALSKVIEAIEND